MAVAEKTRTKEDGALFEGLGFYTVKAQFDKTKKDIERLCNIFSIATPIAFLLFYVISAVFLMLSSAFDYRLIIKCIMSCLVVAELVFNIRKVKKLQNRAEKKNQKKYKKISTYIKIALFAIPAFVAVYQVIVYEGSIWQFITAVALVIVLVVRVALEVVKFIVEKYVQAFVIAAIMDVEKIVNSKLGKIVGFIGDSGNKISSVFAKILGKQEQEIDSEEEELSLIDGLSYDYNDNEELRKTLREQAKEYKEKNKK